MGADWELEKKGMASGSAWYRQGKASYRMIEGSPLTCRNQEFQPYLSLCDDEDIPFVDKPPYVVGRADGGMGRLN